MLSKIGIEPCDPINVAETPTSLDHPQPVVHNSGNGLSHIGHHFIPISSFSSSSNSMPPRASARTCGRASSRDLHGVQSNCSHALPLHHTWHPLNPLNLSFCFESLEVVRDYPTAPFPNQDKHVGPLWDLPGCEDKIFRHLLLDTKVFEVHLITAAVDLVPAMAESIGRIPVAARGVCRVRQ